MEALAYLPQVLLWVLPQVLPCVLPREWSDRLSSCEDDEIHNRSEQPGYRVQGLKGSRT